MELVTFLTTAVVVVVGIGKTSYHLKIFMLAVPIMVTSKGPIAPSNNNL